MTSIAADMDELDQDCTLPADKEFCADLRNLMDEYTVARDETIRISDRSSDEATAYFRANAAPLAKELSQQINTMLTEKSTAGNIQSKTLTKQARTSLITNIPDQYLNPCCGNCDFCFNCTKAHKKLCPPAQGDRESRKGNGERQFPDISDLLRTG